MIVLDTNVLSELMRANPNEHAVRWISSELPNNLYITAVTQAEVLHGIALLPKGKRRLAIANAAEAMFREDFNGRVLPFDSDAARAYAEIVIERRDVGRPISQFDAQIAAIVRCTRSILATRNVTDFEHCGIRVVNPWQAR